MADLLHLGVASVRQADAVLRASGGRNVLLRMPAPAVPNDPGEQLGLATPQFVDLPLGPAVLRKNTSVRSLLLAASAVAAATATMGYDAAEVLFRTAAGIVIDDVLYAIEASVATTAFGQPCSYTLTLRPPAQ